METSATRLYASSIAIVSGVYAIGSALTSMGARMGMSMQSGDGLGVAGWIMLVIGVVVLVHGAVLLVGPLAAFARLSGPLMIVWAVVMLAQQALAALVPGFAMTGGAMASAATWDAGMVAIAMLMLVSGLIMLRPAQRAM